MTQALNILLLVTERGLHCLDLGDTIWGFNPNNPLATLAVEGEFAGLDILHPNTDFPIVLTTSKNERCTFLEQRGVQRFTV